MQNHEQRVAHRWMLLIALGLTGLFGLVLYRLTCLHLYNLENEGQERKNYYAKKLETLGLRGRILDRNGVVLTESLPGREIYIDWKDPKLDKLPEERRAELPLELAKLLNVKQELLIDAYTGARKSYLKVCDVADDRVIRELERLTSTATAPSNRVAGVNFSEQRSIRSYPNGARMSHVLGYVNTDGIGVYGIEQRFNDFLQGKNGEIKTLKSGDRREIRSRRISETPPVHGHDVYLTLDNNIQYIIERELSKALETFRANSGIIIVQRIKTGEILGMAMLPSFNPMEYRLFSKDAWKNIAISRNYEPGSVMKAVTVAMALQYGVITEHTPFDVGTACVWYYAGKPLRDHARGIVHAKEILAQSSNIGTAMIGLRLAEPSPKNNAPKANELLWRAFSEMGFREPTGIELVGEERGILHHYSTWSKLSPTRLPIGQGIAVTAVQLCNAYATIGNGGVRMKPTIIKELRTHEGELVKKWEPKVLGTPLSPTVSKKMLELMQAVTDRTQGGTATKAALPSYLVAGKTGTGQIPVNGSYNHSDYNASFVGIYPASKPELAILVTIERPQGRFRMGGSVAAPTFAAVAEEIGHYLGLPADKPTSESQR